MLDTYTTTNLIAIVFVPTRGIDCAKEFHRWTGADSASATATQCVGLTSNGKLARVEVLTDNILSERIAYALHAYEHPLLPLRYAPGFELGRLESHLEEVTRGARGSDFFDQARRLAVTVTVHQAQPSSEAAAKAIRRSLPRILTPTGTEYVDLTLTYNERTDFEGTTLNRLVRAEALQSVEFVPGQPARPKAFAASWTFDFSTVHGLEPFGPNAAGSLLDALVREVKEKVKEVIQ